MIHLLPTRPNFTPLPNSFLFHSMAKMSSTVIKIYLFLLYQFEQRYPSLDFDEIADVLNVTESDINRSIAHLEKAGLLVCTKEDNRYISLALPGDTGAIPAAKPAKVATPVASQTAEPQEKSSQQTKEISLEESTPLSPTLPPMEVKSRPSYTALQIKDFSADLEGEQLIFFTKTLLKKNLTANDLHTLYGLRDWLGMSYELIYYLIEYCVEKKHTHLSYIEKTAINWHENHIETVDQAKEYLATYPNHYYTVLKAYGIYNLAPIPAQIKMIDKWMKEYLFPIETIAYACEKTILQAGKPELNYTDRILSSWHKKKLVTKQQVLEMEASADKKAFPAAAKPAQSNMKSTSFNNYSQRNEDYAAIEKRALEMRLKKKESKQ